MPGRCQGRCRGGARGDAGGGARGGAGGGTGGGARGGARGGAGGAGGGVTLYSIPRDLFLLLGFRNPGLFKSQDSREYCTGAFIQYVKLNLGDYWNLN